MKTEYAANEDELVSILRRLDIDGDGKINF